MNFECKSHPGCIWSCNCKCENCILYNKTYIDTEKSFHHKKLKSKLKTKLNKTTSLTNNYK